ncbi:MAG: hypothetical protein AUH89_01560 [Ktedonobacter sp. 13_1_40CM_4_52_4]|nr:MAG: hypothetical protein AUH89_01560 [Ktedonobacter sp. 13_1_40CM_4_52_4]
MQQGVQRHSASSCRIASQKSFFVRCKYLFSSDSVLVAPPRLHLRSSTLEQERNMAYVTEKEEDVP